MILAGQNKTFTTLLSAVVDHLPHDALRVSSVTVERMCSNGQQHKPSTVDIILLRCVEHIVCQVNSVCRESMNKRKHLAAIVKKPKEIAVQLQTVFDFFFFRRLGFVKRSGFYQRNDIQIINRRVSDRHMRLLFCVSLS